MTVKCTRHGKLCELGGRHVVHVTGTERCDSAEFEARYSKLIGAQTALDILTAGQMSGPAIASADVQPQFCMERDLETAMLVSRNEIPGSLIETTDTHRTFRLGVDKVWREV